MTSPTTSTNPFRRKAPLSAPPSSTPSGPSPSPSTLSLRPTLINPSVFDPDADTAASEASEISTTPRSKVPKKVRVQSPPSSPRVIGPGPGESSQSLETVSTENDGDPFGEEDDDEGGDGVYTEVGLEAAVASQIARDQEGGKLARDRTEGPPHNPFAKTLKDLETLGDKNENIKAAPETVPVKNNAARASLDVEAFKRLLLTGSSDLESAPSISAKSSTDDSQHPRQTSIHAQKVPPPPPNSRHGRSIKSIDLSSNPPTVSPRKVTPTSTLDLSASTTPIRSPITPPPPRRRGERTVSDEYAPPKSPAKAAPMPPPPRRPVNRGTPVSSGIAAATVASGMEKSGASPPPAATSLHGRVKPPPPPARHSSVKRTEGIMSPSVSGAVGMERKMSNGSRGPPPPVTPRGRGGSRGSVDDGKRRSLEVKVEVMSEMDYMAELSALQREVEEAIKGTGVGTGASR